MNPMDTMDEKPKARKPDVDKSPYIDKPAKVNDGKIAVAKSGVTRRITEDMMTEWLANGWKVIK